MKNKVCIIDIDGCILDNVFSNFDEKLSKKEMNKRLKNTELYRYFLDFVYYHIRENDKILFITGRRKKDLGKLTKKQLKSLKYMKVDYKIVFYPKYLEHSKRNYSRFKINWCEFVINSCYFKYNLDKKILIIDDMDYYFDDIKIIDNRMDVSFFKIENKYDWSKIMNELMLNE